MRKRLLKFRRDRWRDQVIQVGRRLREQERSRAGINSDRWPDVCAEIDENINRLTRRRDSLLTKLRETA